MKITTKLKQFKKQKPGHMMAGGVLAIILALSLVLNIAVPNQAQSQTDIDSGQESILDKLFSIVKVENDTAMFPISEEREPVQVIWVVATAYSSSVDQTDDTPCITANGHDLCEYYEENGTGNTIAANFMYFDENVRFPDMFGDKTFVVRDRMNKRYGQGRIDIWMPTRAEAIAFGVRRIKMEVYN